MGKSLTEAAEAVLKGNALNEGEIPSVSSSDNNPDRDAKSSNPNMASLKPKSKHADADPKHNEAEDLGGATPTSTAKENLGAKAASKVSKDKSKSGIPSVGPEQNKSLHEDEEVDEELDAIIAEMIEAGMSEDEIADTIAEALSEDEEVLDEEVELSEELETFIAKCIEEGMDDDAIEAAIAENFEVIEEESPSVEQVASEIKSRIMEEPIDIKEDVDALLSGEQLSEDFRNKATTIFESAIKARLSEEIDILEKTYQTSLDEKIAAVRSELAEQVDDYLNYVIENWVSENEVAIQAGLRSELTEDFIAGLRNLFAEHYIDIPEDKVSIVEELGKKVEELEAKLNEEIEYNVGLVKQINEAVKFEVLVGATENLTATQAEKLKTLAEGLEFVSPEDYQQKVETLKENYFPTKVNSTAALDQAESSGSGMISEEVQGRMGAYVKALGRTIPN